MATQQLGTPSDRPEDTATQESIDDALENSPDAGSGASAQSLRDTLFRALTDDDRISNTNNDLLLAAQNTRPQTVVGVLGGENIAEDIVAIVKAFVPSGDLAELKLWAKTVKTHADQGGQVYADAEGHGPETYFLANGDEIAVPGWADYVDLIAVGRGGNSSGDTPTAGRYAQPGSAGGVNKTTLQRTTHFSGTPTVECGGASLTLGAHTITAANGVDGTGTTTTRPVGKAPDPFTFKEVPYEFGGDQEALGANGTVPGGGANGRHWLLGRLRPNSTGGAAGGWVTFRADAVPDEEVEEPEGDTTAPDTDDLDVAIAAVTTTGFTLTPSGAVDA